jgi:hypothetical protein
MDIRPKGKQMQLTNASRFFFRLFSSFRRFSRAFSLSFIIHFSHSSPSLVGVPVSLGGVLFVPRLFPMLLFNEWKE